MTSGRDFEGVNRDHLGGNSSRKSQGEKQEGDQAGFVLKSQSRISHKNPVGTELKGRGGGNQKETKLAGERSKSGGNEGKRAG